MPTAERRTPERDFLPALRWPVLLRVYDPLVRATTRERRFKGALLDQAAVRDGEAVLDLGCGTGTLAVALARRCRGARLTGLDADPDVLARAAVKAAEAGADVELVEGLSTDLPFPDGRFDVVLSSLFFHHLAGPAKRRTLAEVARVLKPGGRLHVADWGRPQDPAMAAAFAVVRAFDGFAVTADNARGALPALCEEAGLQEAAVRSELRTAFGTLALYSARRPAG